MGASLPLPAGTVTFLFTDIEASSLLWEQFPDAMSEALARHDAILRRVIQERQGRVFKTIGDEHCAAFATAPEAVAAARAIYQALQAEVWGATGPLRVRMALHTGAAEERDGDYFGPPLNRIARLLEAARGGQILLSLATQELSRDSLPEAASLRDLGEHRLRDLVRPERVFQLLAPDLPADFPALRTLSVRPNNLPAQPTPLIGREQEVEAARRMLRREDVRLITFTGPGGTGKTRLGLQVAADSLTAFLDGAFFVNLAPIHDPQWLGPTIARVLDIRETNGHTIVERLQEHLQEKQALLLLDNFEQVLAAAPLVATLLQAAPRVKIIVTSRAALRLRGEQEFPVPPLALPPLVDRGRLRAEGWARSEAGSPLAPTIRLHPSPISQYAAVQLFIQRAMAVSPDFAITTENAPAVAAICHRLDGLPLAIELAAARIKLLPPQAMLGRLESRLKLLTGGPRDLPARQQTLRGAVAWSYDLLDEGEKALFRCLSVFVGGWTMEAAEAVCGDFGLGRQSQGQPAAVPSAPSAIQNLKSKIQNLEVLDGLASLVDKSLLRQEEPDTGAEGGEPRFTMLETIREYGQECLQASGEAAAVRSQHADYFLAWIEALSGTEAAQLDQLDRDHDNLRAALAWYQERGQAALACRLGTAAWRLWYLRGYWTVGREQLAALLAMLGAPPPARAILLRQAGQLAWLQSDYPAARSLLERSIALYRALGHTEHMPAPLNALGEVARTQGDYAAARALFAESLSLLREQQADRGSIGWSIQALGEVAYEQGDREAQALMEESLLHFQEANDPRGVSFALSYLGMMAHAGGDLRKARLLQEQSLALQREIGHKGGIARSLGCLADVAVDEGDLETARSLGEQSMRIRLELGDRRGLAASLEQFARVAVATETPLTAAAAGESQPAPAHSALGSPVPALRRAACFLGAAAALRDALGAPLPPVARAAYERHVEGLRAALGETAFVAAWAEGQSLKLEEAIALALDESRPDGPLRLTASPNAGP